MSGKGERSSKRRPERSRLRSRSSRTLRSRQIRRANSRSASATSSGEPSGASPSDSIAQSSATPVIARTRSCRFAAAIAPFKFFTTTARQILSCRDRARCTNLKKTAPLASAGRVLHTRPVRSSSLSRVSRYGVFLVCISRHGSVSDISRRFDWRNW